MNTLIEQCFRVAVLTAMICTFGMCLSAGSSFAQRFLDHGDGTVTDTETDLMWTRDANPMDPPDIRDRPKWNAAVSQCDSFNLADHSDWRLPSIEELAAIYTSVKESESPFTNISESWYCSISTYEENPDLMWVISMVNGKRYKKFKERGCDGCSVWPVRGGPE